MISIWWTPPFVAKILTTSHSVPFAKMTESPVTGDSTSLVRIQATPLELVPSMVSKAFPRVMETPGSTTAGMDTPLYVIVSPCSARLKKMAESAIICSASVIYAVASLGIPGPRRTVAVAPATAFATVQIPAGMEGFVPTLLSFPSLST